MKTSFDFSGRVIPVTGGTQGVGLGIARAFANAGAEVHITGKRNAAADYDDDLSGFAYHRRNWRARTEPRLDSGCVIDALSRCADATFSVHALPALVRPEISATTVTRRRAVRPYLRVASSCEERDRWASRPRSRSGAISTRPR